MRWGDVSGMGLPSGPRRWDLGCGCTCLQPHSGSEVCESPQVISAAFPGTPGQNAHVQAATPEAISHVKPVTYKNVFA